MRIAIIGCGNMGTGLAELLSPFHHILLHDRDWVWTQELSHQIKGQACQHLHEAVEQAEVIFLAIKPQNLKEVALSMATFLKDEHVIISLLAGTPIAVLKYYFPNTLLIRTMPNLAMRYGAGITGIVDSKDFSADFKNKLEELLKPLGMIYWIKENKIDALTSLAGSGPAFILTLIEAMIEAGISMGLQAKNAEVLILQMIQGSLALIQNTGKHPAELKRQIASPNGTTIAGLRVLEKENLRSGMIETFLAAYQHALEISKSHEIEDQ